MVSWPVPAVEWSSMFRVPASARSNSGESLSLERTPLQRTEAAAAEGTIVGLWVM